VLRPYPVQVLRELSELKPGFYGEVQSVGIPQYGSSLADVAKLMISPLWFKGILLLRKDPGEK
jgi:hypothetical protein